MTRIELTFEEFCALSPKYCSGISFAWGAQRVYRDDALGVQIEVVTERKRYDDIYSGWKPEKRYYYLDGDKNQYDTIDQLYVAYMENVCGVKQ